MGRSREKNRRLMIESAGSGVDVDGLMARLRKRVFDIRDRPSGGLPINALSLRSNVFINSLEAYTNIADLKTQIRTRWPSNIGATFPFSITKVRDASLKALAFLFKDQRHVNVALIAALREQISLNRHMIEQMQILRDELEAIRSNR